MVAVVIVFRGNLAPAVLAGWLGAINWTPLQQLYAADIGVDTWVVFLYSSYVLCWIRLVVTFFIEVPLAIVR
jgi:hypothetical protein